MENKILFSVLGALLVAFGVDSIFERRFYSPKEGGYIDLGDIHAVIGIFSIVVGLAFLFVTWRKKKTKVG